LIPVGSVSSEPTWGTEVSRALRSLSAENLPASSNHAPLPAPAASPPIAIQIIHGNKSEQRCFWEKTRQAADCASTPATGAPDKPGGPSPAPTAPPA
jgi:hypothetical protein